MCQLLAILHKKIIIIIVAKVLHQCIYVLYSGKF